MIRSFRITYCLLTRWTCKKKALPARGGEGEAHSGVLEPVAEVPGVVVPATDRAIELGRPRSDAHRLETLYGTVISGVFLGLGAAFGQAAGSLIARPVMTTGIDPYLASLFRVGASGLAMSVLAATPFAPP